MLQQQTVHRGAGGLYYNIILIYIFRNTDSSEQR